MRYLWEFFSHCTLLGVLTALFELTLPKIAPTIPSKPLNALTGSKLLQLRLAYAPLKIGIYLVDILILREMLRQIVQISIEHVPRVKRSLPPAHLSLNIPPFYFLRVIILLISILKVIQII